MFRRGDLDRGGIRLGRSALAAIAVAALVACSGSSSKPSAAFCATVKAIQQANLHPPVLPNAQQQYQRALGKVDQLAAVSPPSVRSALLTLAETFQPLAAGEAVGMTPKAEAAAEKRQIAAVTTVDEAARNDCGLDVSMFGKNNQTPGT
jgi:hypothetical protein